MLGAGAGTGDVAASPIGSVKLNGSDGTCCHIAGPGASTEHVLCSLGTRITARQLRSV